AQERERLPRLAGADQHFAELFERQGGGVALGAGAPPQAFHRPPRPPLAAAALFDLCDRRRELLLALRDVAEPRVNVTEVRVAPPRLGVLVAEHLAERLHGSRARVRRLCDIVRWR